MRYIKSFENTINNTPKVRDYTYCETPDIAYQPNNFIGRLLNRQRDSLYPYIVRYTERNENGKIIYKEDRMIKKNEMIDFDKNKEELETRINARKYNL